MNFDAVINRKNRNSAKWDEQILKEKYGYGDLMPFWVADMDFACPPIVRDTLEKQAAHGIFGYPATDKFFLKAWQNWTAAEHNWTVPLENVRFTPGVVAAMSLGVHIYSSPGDNIILCEPVYQPFRSMIIRNKRNPLVNQLILKQDRYEMDFSDMEEKASQPKTTLLLLCSPHNPGGRVWTREELGRVDRICRKHGVFVVSDEIHADLVLGNIPHTPFSSLTKEAAANAMTLMAPSKTFNIAGEKLSVAIFGSMDRQNTFRDAQLAFASEEGSALAIGEAVYREGGEWLAALKVYLRENIRICEDFLCTYLPEVKLMKPDAGFIGWLDFRGLGLGHKEVQDRLIQRGKIALVEGKWFGQGGEGFFRINYGCPRSLLTEGLERLAESMT